MNTKDIIEQELPFTQEREQIRQKALINGDPSLNSLEQVDDLLFDSGWHLPESEIVGAAGLLVEYLLKTGAFRLLGKRNGDAFDFFLVGDGLVYVEFPFHRCLLRRWYNPAPGEMFLSDIYHGVLVDLYERSDKAIVLNPVIRFDRERNPPDGWSLNVVRKVDRLIAGEGLRNAVRLIGFESERPERLDRFVPEVA